MHNYWSSGQEVKTDDLLKERTFPWGLVSKDHDLGQREQSTQTDISEQIYDGDDLSEVIDEEASLHQSNLI